MEKRLTLKNTFLKHRILLLDGHCSFINLAHAEMDFERWALQCHAVFTEWMRAL
jgi:hypothetical protein